MIQRLFDFLNNFFSNIVTNLKTPNHSNFAPFAKIINDSTLKNIVKYRNYLSILAIQDKFKNNVTNVTSWFERKSKKKKKKKKKLNLNSKETSQDSDVPVKILKSNNDIFSEFVHNALNRSFKSSKFPPILKLTNITPIQKKEKQDLKENCRPISILSNLL